MKRSRFDRRHLLRLLGLGASSLAVAPLLSSCALNPATGSRHLMMLSEDEEISLDRQQSPQQFSSDYGKVRDQGLNAYLDGVGKSLATRSHRPHMPYSFRAVNAAYINAYAFPGGSIAATRGILVEMENEAELAALLGHEIGHVNARHSAPQASKSLLASIFVSGASLASSVAGLGAAGRARAEYARQGVIPGWTPLYLDGAHCETCADFFSECAKVFRFRWPTSCA